MVFSARQSSQRLISGRLALAPLRPDFLRGLTPLDPLPQALLSLGASPCKRRHVCGGSVLRPPSLLFAPGSYTNVRQGRTKACPTAASRRGLCWRWGRTRPGAGPTQAAVGGRAAAARAAPCPAAGQARGKGVARRCVPARSSPGSAPRVRGPSRPRSALPVEAQRSLRRGQARTRRRWG